MALNIRKFLNGIRLVPKASTTIDSQGELEVLSASGKANYHNGTSASPVVTEAHAAPLTNKTIDADLNTITNIDNNEIKALAGIDATKIANGTVTNADFQSIPSLVTNSANRTLSNLTAPTAINEPLVMQSSTAFPGFNFIQTQNQTAANSVSLQFFSGEVTGPGFSSGNIVSSSGNKSGGGSGNSGSVFFGSGFVTDGTGNSGSASFRTGDVGGSGTGNSGATIYRSGDVGGTGATGSVTLRSGNSSSGNTGQITINTGNSSSGGTTGNITITPGTTSGIRGVIFLGNSAYPSTDNTQALGDSTSKFERIAATQILGSTVFNDSRIDMTNRALFHNNTTSLNWASRTLVDSTGLINSVDWANRLLIDSANNNIVNWGSTYKNVGSTVSPFDTMVTKEIMMSPDASNDAVIQTTSGVNQFFVQSANNLFIHSGAGATTPKDLTIIANVYGLPSGASSGRIYTRSQDILTGSGNSGLVEFRSGGTISGNSGEVFLQSGPSTSGNTGNIWFNSGNGSALTGTINIRTGNASAGSSGSIDISTGTATTDRGAVRIDARYLKLPFFSTNPTSPETAASYYNSSTQELRIWTGSTWIPVGANNVSFQNVTSNTTLASSVNFVTVDATSGNVQVTLATAADLKPVKIKRIDNTANVVSIIPAAGLIDGATVIYLANQYDNVELVPNGTNWSVF